MPVFAIPLHHLAVLSDGESWADLTESEIVARVRRHFAFLGPDLQIEIRDGTAFISRNAVSNKLADEATDLVDKAGRRAQAGEFSKAVDLYERALKLNPSLPSAWRDLAMAQMERGQFDAARDALIDALRLDPNDAWSFVVLANLYAKQKGDFAQARRFYERALELKPDDPWALNGFAAAVAEQGDHAEALRLFDLAIAADRTFANAWCGKALVLLRDHRPADAAVLLESMFREARVQDVRSNAVFDEGRRLFAAAQGELAKSGESDAFKAVEDYRSVIERESGFPVKMEEGSLPGQIAAMVQIAWKHGREHHKIVLRKSPPPSKMRTRVICSRTN